MSSLPSKTMLYVWLKMHHFVTTKKIPWNHFIFLCHRTVYLIFMLVEILGMYEDANALLPAKILLPWEVNRMLI